MYELFIELLDQLYWNGYGVEFQETNLDAFNRQLAEFSNNNY
ncbi:hypothetical protein BDD43_0174 [Mucilaginibacter gracilis]|uniref:Uncharacterized protein n=1 Tax=Mucilaginibacter gracilis TaxID=423350 RepID=A0A495IUV2_9SPHI|nr:hypothetical protein [Mucilaginibacter gracilis]RKR80081.1 hypothetical protein BDD43_0174 [Mucilaginibacter gracilis]